MVKKLSMTCDQQLVTISVITLSVITLSDVLHYQFIIGYYYIIGCNKCPWK